jgi:hypothetical protein
MVVPDTLPSHENEKCLSILPHARPLLVAELSIQIVGVGVLAASPRETELGASCNVRSLVDITSPGDDCLTFYFIEDISESNISLKLGCGACGPVP